MKAPSGKAPRIPLYIAIVGAIALGVLVGPLLGKGAGPFGELGTLVIRLIKAVATPLLFFAILNAVLKTDIAARQGARMLAIATINASIALAIGLLLSNLLKPGSQLLGVVAAHGVEVSYAEKKLDFLDALAGYIPSNFVTPFSENSILSIIIIALLLGFGLRAVRREENAESAPGIRTVESVVATFVRVMEVTLGWVIKLIPFAVFGVVAKTVGEYGFAPLKGLGAYVAVGVLGLVLHVTLTYQLWVKLVARLSLRRFWVEAREPVVYALGTNSSLATLPVTLGALDRLGVSRSASALGACVGTNLNNDGIILYEGMAVLFVAQASGMHLSLTEQLLAALSCLVAAMGVAGVPEAGIVSLALVLNTVGLPTELLPLLLTVDWIIARGRSATNVLSDMILSIILDSRAAKTRAADGEAT